jgi:hypothetical protein
MGKTLIEQTFDEIDEHFSILSSESRSWIKNKLMYHISEAYERGRKEGITDSVENIVFNFEPKTI